MPISPITSAHPSLGHQSSTTKKPFKSPRDFAINNPAGHSSLFERLFDEHSGVLQIPAAFSRVSRTEILSPLFLQLKPLEAGASKTAISKGSHITPGLSKLLGAAFEEKKYLKEPLSPRVYPMVSAVHTTDIPQEPVSESQSKQDHSNESKLVIASEIPSEQSDLASFDSGYESYDSLADLIQRPLQVKNCEYSSITPKPSNSQAKSITQAIKKARKIFLGKAPEDHKISVPLEHFIPPVLSHIPLLPAHSDQLLPFQRSYEYEDREQELVFKIAIVRPQQPKYRARQINSDRRVKVKFYETVDMFEVHGETPANYIPVLCPKTPTIIPLKWLKGKITSRRIQSVLRTCKNTPSAGPSILKKPINPNSSVELERVEKHESTDFSEFWEWVVRRLEEKERNEGLVSFKRKRQLVRSNARRNI